MEHVVSQREVKQALARLKDVLAPRVGPKGTADIVRNFGRMQEQGVPPAGVLQAIATTVDSFSSRDPIVSPWSIAMSRAVATVAPKKLAHFSFFHDGRSQFDDVIVGVVADHARALLPACDDVDTALGVAWQNILTYHCALVGGECWNRNSAGPVSALWAAAADARLADDDVPLALLPGRGLLIARGHTPPREDAPFVCREVQVQLWGRGRHSLGLVGDGSFEGVIGLLEALALPLEVAWLPLLLRLVALPLPAGTALVDVDGLIGGLAAAEDRQEQERLAGPAAQAAATRLGVQKPAPVLLRSLRLRADDTVIAISADEDGLAFVCVD
jgi:hypothetical protein